MKPVVTVIAWVGLLFVVSFARADETASPAGLEFFEKKIRPVLVTHCHECHSGEAAAKKQLKGGLRLDSRPAMLKGGDSGPAVVPGKVDESLLIDALRYDGLEMPPKGKLPDAVVADFEAWIKMGAPDPRLESPAAPRKEIDIAAGRQHWSYRLPPRHPPPAVKQAAWPLGEIDRFLLAALEAKALRPVAEVDRAVLARRVYFDLLGLPPSPEGIDELITDAAPDAFERLVDRLLASPHFGERWGRHWLDVARFAESLTLRGFILPEAWRYRDYVIEHFNRDRPFDRFVQEQVAGDLLSAESLDDRRRQLAATTFLVLGNTNLEEQDKQQLEMDVVDEQLDVIAKGFIAQTVTCARCHDHKFDPIPTRDYYALAGILKNARTLEHANVSKWLEFPLPVEPPQEQMFTQHDAAVAALQSRIKTAKEATKVAATDKPAPTPAAPAVLAAKDLPGIVVDDSQAKRVGEWKLSQYSARYIGDGYLHDLDTGKGEKTLTFLFEPPQAGKYEVRLAYSPGTNRTEAAPVTVFSADGERTIHVNQRETPPIDGRFVSLGQYRFEPNGQSFVIVDNEQTTGHVIADAVQFLPVEKLDDTSRPTPPLAAAPDERNRPLDDTNKTRAMDELKRLESELTQLTERGPKRPLFMSVQEEKTIADIPIHIRGSVHNLSDPAPRGFLQVASYGPPRAISPRESGRRELAEWLASRDNPLTARVFANRAWHWLFGVGLVRTTDNFGTTGETPSHAELLDQMAVRFMDDGWSTKSLIRGMATSRAYRMQSVPSANPQSTIRNPQSIDPQSIDPENRLLMRMNRRRLDAECLLDSILSASGQLRFEMGGATIKPGTSADYGYQHINTRRAVYWPVLRNSLPEIFEAFDFADPSVTTGRRDTSTVAQQALFLMNHPFVLERASQAADRLLAEDAPDESTRITRAYRTLLGRNPTDAERNITLEFLGRTAGDKTSRRAAWTQFVQALCASLEFRYLE